MEPEAVGGLSFDGAGKHDLKGVSGRWHLYRVTDEPATARP